MAFSSTFFLSGPPDTDKLGLILAEALHPGDTILLHGQIGAGKSHLTRAIIQALFATEGVENVEIPSPTYTLVQTYDTAKGPLWHADLYRLGDISEITELGLDEAFGRDIALVEWPDLIDPPERALVITLTPEGEGRRANLTSESPRWDGIAVLLEPLHA